MPLIATELLSRVDELQTRYITALDEKSMEQWLATFSTRADASYILTTAESVAAGRQIALIMDDTRSRLEDRVSLVTRVWEGIFQDYQTRHFVQRTSLRSTAADVVEVRTNFSAFFTPIDTGRTEVLAAGIYLDRVVIEGDRALFLSKTAILDSALLARYVVYPL